MEFFNYANTLLFGGAGIFGLYKIFFGLWKIGKSWNQRNGGELDEGIGDAVGGLIIALAAGGSWYFIEQWIAKMS